MKKWDFGIYGEGVEGYLHYKQAFDESTKNSSNGIPDDYYDFESDELEDDISDFPEVDDEVDDMEDNSDVFDETTIDTDSISIEIPVTISFSVDTSDNHDQEAVRPPNVPSAIPVPLPPDFDLTPYYCDADCDDNSYYFEVALRKAMSDFFPVYKENYENSKKWNSEILAGMFKHDKPLGLEMWKWQLEHFNTALVNPQIGHVLTTMNDLKTRTFEWLFKTSINDEWLWKKFFGQSTVIWNTHADFLRLALKKNEVNLFIQMMDFYLNNTSPQADDSYTLDQLLEEVMTNCWKEKASLEAISAIDGYIQKVQGSIRREELLELRKGAFANFREKNIKPTSESAQDNENNAKIKELQDKFYALLSDPNTTNGDYGQTSKVQETLLLIFGISVESGASCWYDVLVNYQYEKRFQDYTTYMVEELYQKFGIDWMIDFFCEYQDIENFIFCFSSEYPRSFLLKLLETDRLFEAKYYFGLIAQNTCYAFIIPDDIMQQLKSFSSKHRQITRIQNKNVTAEVVKEYSSKQYMSLTPRMERFLKHWCSSAISVWERTKQYTEPRIIKMNEYVTLKTLDIAIPIESIEMSKETLPDEILQLEKKVYSEMDSGSNATERLLAITALLDAIRKEFHFCFVLNISGTKNDQLSYYIAQRAEYFFALPPLLNDDMENNIICAYHKYEKDDIRNYTILLLTFLQFSWGIELQPRNTLFLQGVNIFDLLSVVFPKEDESNLPQFKSKIEKNKKVIEQLYRIYGKDNMTIFWNLANTDLRCICNDLDHLHMSFYRDCGFFWHHDTINSFKQDLYQHLLDSGMITHKWVSERRMYEIVKSVYDDAIFQFHAGWLGRQSYDVYVPSIKTAFEFQGEQHYSPIDFFGGEEAYQNRVELDKVKRDLSQSNGVTLIEWKYDEDLSVLVLNSKLEQASIS